MTGTEERTQQATPYGRLAGAAPVPLAVAASACISASAMFVKLSGVNAGTAAFLRCALALVALVPLALLERRRLGPRPVRAQRFDLVAGALLGVDFVFWAQSIHDVGSSIATVLLNIQIAVFPAAGPRRHPHPARRPLLAHPARAAARRRAGQRRHRTPRAGQQPGLRGALRGRRRSGVRRIPVPDPPGRRRGAHTLPPVCVVSTLAAGVTSGVLGALWTGIDPAPGWGPLGWLTVMSLFGQVLALVLMGPALARLAPVTSAALLLLLQPVLALGLGVVFLGERPTATQFAGCVLVVLAVWHTSRPAH